MKHTILAIAALLLLPAALAQVKISEVYVDPIGTESGGEAIELKNTGSSPIDISGYVIKTETAAADATIPGGSILAANAYYLIADAGWSTAKDNPAWPDANHMEAMTFTNSNAGVALLDAQGTTLDAVGWGTPADISPGLFEGTPVSSITPGMSLVRIQDTNDNQADFSTSDPNLQSSGTGGGSSNQTPNAISFAVTVLEPIIEIKNVSTFDEDQFTAGTQVYPIPNMKKNMTFVINVSDPDRVTSVEVRVNTKQAFANRSGNAFVAHIPMNFYDHAGTYDAVVYVSTVTSTKNQTITFEYIGMTAFALDTGTIGCEVTPGQHCEVSGDTSMNSTDHPTIQNIGNTNLNLKLHGEALVGSSGSIGVDSIKYYFSGDLTTIATLSSSPQLALVDMEYGAQELLDVSFLLDVPPNAAPGEYLSSIYVAAVSS